MSEWISVDDRLPNNLHPVLIKQIYEDEILIGYINNHGEWIEQCNNIQVYGDAYCERVIAKVFDEEDYLKVTHWMPLPQPPNKS